ncbi:ABC transporter ATP-binding protein [Microlunatus sp. GCM10028923]|uniref:ATP-binding cassette domain-containing protein n=1 Tax=Microlunatus sp. GCM10028923 TaxID=3273400 RepID=UPI0036203A23
MNTTKIDNATRLREWARGLYTTEAAAELLIRAMSGRLMNGPWIGCEDDGTVWFDTSQVREAGYLSGGERRLLDLAASLSADRPVHLGDTLTGLDRSTVVLVLAAMAHAAGTHEHSRMTTEATTGRPTGFEQLTSLYPWPTDQIA